MFFQTFIYSHEENIKDKNFLVGSLVHNTVNIPSPFKRDVVSKEYLQELDAIKEEMLNGEFFSLDDVDSLG